MESFQISYFFHLFFVEAHKLPGQPALELSLAQIDNCLKMMGKNGLGACAMVNLKNFYCDSDTYS